MFLFFRLTKLRKSAQLKQENRSSRFVTRRKIINEQKEASKNQYRYLLLLEAIEFFGGV